MQKLQRNNTGFTIIEVLIVLAIAGLIMLIVFLAVPALQRNSRNTTYRSEAGQTLSAASEFISNNNGNPPSNGSSGTSGTDAEDIMALTNNKSITILNIASGASSSVSPPDSFDTAIMHTGARCGTANGSSYSVASGPDRSLALVFAVEDSSGNVVAQCQES